jgi:tripartite-type tricarboxylate transporter receptor subunit TctC
MTAHTPRRRHLGQLAALASLGLLAALPQAAQAQAYPNRPIRLVVPFTPGGSTDILARAIGLELGKAWNASVVVENVPGAGGAIGADKVAKAPADGHTLLMGHIGTLAVNPSLYPRLPYSPLKDFTPVAWVANVPNVLVLHPATKAANMKEFVAYAKSNPGRLNYGSGGNGSAANLATEYLKMRSEISLVHIPYRGTAPAVNDLVAGQTQVLFTGVPAVIGQIRNGQLKPLAVSGKARVEALPDVPTVNEALGLKDFEADQWYGVVAPTGTPPEVIARLNQAINAALNSAELKKRLGAEGAVANPTTPEAFGKYIAAEIERWKPVITSGRVKID